MLSIIKNIINWQVNLKLSFDIVRRVRAEMLTRCAGFLINVEDSKREQDREMKRVRKRVRDKYCSNLYVIK